MHSCSRAHVLASLLACLRAFTPPRFCACSPAREANARPGPMAPPQEGKLQQTYEIFDLEGLSFQLISMSTLKFTQA